MKRMFRAKTYVGVILHVGLVLCVFLLCFDAAAGNRGKGKKKKQDVLVSKPKPKKVEEEGVNIVSGKVKGTVGGIGRRFISVVYKKDNKTKGEYELCILIDENVKIVNKEKLNEIKMGDTVTVVYEEKHKSYEKKKKDGTVEKGTKLAGRVATKITVFDPEGQGVLTSE